MTSPVYYHEGRFPPHELDWGALVPLIGPAVAALARYDGALAAVPNPDVLLAPLTTQEAVLSARIEGTQATIGEVYQFEAGQIPATPERRDDIDEILNYRRAMRQAETMLDELPLSLRVVRETHEVLLSGVRGRNKSPGQFRRIPNWIGPSGCTIDEAKFVPVGAENLDAAMKPLGALYPRRRARPRRTSRHTARGVRGDPSLLGWQRAVGTHVGAALPVATRSDPTADVLHQCLLRSASRRILRRSIECLKR